MRSEKGIAQLSIIALLIIGILTGLALISRPQIFKSQAEELSEVPFFVVGHDVVQSDESVEETKRKVEALHPGMANSGFGIPDPTANSAAQSETNICNPTQFDQNNWTLVEEVCRNTFAPNERRAVYECQNERKVIETPNDPKCIIATPAPTPVLNNEQTECNRTEFNPNKWELVSEVCRNTYAPNERRAVYECKGERKVIESPNDPKCVAQARNNPQLNDEDNNRGFAEFSRRTGKTLADAKSFIQREFFGNIAKAFDWLLGRG